MIELTPEWIFVAPFLGSLVLLTSWAFYCTWQTGALSKHRAAKQIYQCTACGRVYTGLREVPMAPCPRCGCFNEALRRRPAPGR